MKHALKCLTQKNLSSANVVDGKLILSFPNALKPVVWQMDLTEATSSALEVNENKDNSFTLTLKTQDEKTVDIAPFGKREEAMSGLMAISRALENAHGQIRSSGTQNAGGNIIQPPRRKARLMPLFLSLLGLAILFLVWANISVNGPNGRLDQNTVRTSATSATNINEPGVPVSADDFLRDR